MSLEQILEYPQGFHINGQGHHESLLRSFHILEKVKEYARAGVPSSVILEIAEYLSSTNTEVKWLYSKERGEFQPKEVGV